MEGGIDASSAGSSTHLRANFFFASTPKLASVKVMSGLALRWSSPKVLCGGHAAPQRPKSVDGGQHTPHGTPYPSGRSEEHTSELQSLMRISYAVFCLKKKKNTQTHIT